MCVCVCVCGVCVCVCVYVVDSISFQIFFLYRHLNLA